MAEDQTVQELREEVRRLREEQERLRDQVQTNGHPAATPAEASQQQQEEAPKPPMHQRARGFIRRHRVGLLIAAIVLIAIAIGGYFLLSYFHSYESTDDAFVDGHMNPVTPRIAGTVAAVYVVENQFVSAGQVLAELDPRDYQVRVEQARAAHAQAESQIRAASPAVPITRTTAQTTVSTGEAQVATAQAGVAAAGQEYQARLAETRQAEAQNAKAQSDLARYRTLAAKDEISRQQYDAAVAASKSQAAALEAARAAAAAANKALDQRRSELSQARTRLNAAESNAPRQLAVSRADVTTREANAQAAKAQLDQAELNLAYTKIVAPASGVVTGKAVEVGQHVQAGEVLLSISQVDDLWITANFKETQLGRMRPGQDVEIRVDAFDKTYKGYVDLMPGASGAATSLLPPENATGNFVKVVQRLPVRIRLKPGQNTDRRLRIGMSAEPKVWL